jgi:catechol 2,3-dioxygenase-like lactoylglutathione lyase family enzyme
MDVLSSRILIRPSDAARSRRFYREVLGLAVMREFGGPEHPGVVFHAGNGQIEVSGQGGPDDRRGIALWLQVRDVREEVARLATLGHPVDRPPVEEPWGLVEAWIADPDGIPIVLVEIPPTHPLRLDQRVL